MRKKIAIFCGGPSSEFEVSLLSAKAIYQNINKEKYDPYFFFISKKLTAKLVLGSDVIDFRKIKTETPLLKALSDVKKKKMFALLAGVHGEFVEDGKLQTILETMKIQYSGSDSRGSLIAIDKFISSILASQFKGLYIPKSFLIKKPQLPKGCSFPVLIEPNSAGSSVGVYIIRNQKEFTKYFDAIRTDLRAESILLQELIQDALEISCGCLQKKDGSLITLPPIEIHPKKATFFDYDSKYEIGGSEEITPPVSISKSLSKKISEITCQLHILLGLKTYSRSDYLIKKDRIYYIETNSLPGMTETSLLPQEASAVGIPYTKLLDFLIENS